MSTTYRLKVAPILGSIFALIAIAGGAYRVAGGSPGGWAAVVVGVVCLIVIAMALLVLRQRTKRTSK